MPIGEVIIPTQHREVSEEDKARALEFSSALRTAPNKWLADEEAEYEPAKGKTKKGAALDPNTNAVRAADKMRALAASALGVARFKIRTKNWQLVNGKFAFALRYEPEREAPQTRQSKNGKAG